MATYKSLLDEPFISSRRASRAPDGRGVARSSLARLSLLAAAVALLGAACECDDQFFERLSGSFFTRSSTFELGVVCIGDTVERAFQIENRGPMALSIENVSIDAERGDCPGCFEVVSFPEVLAREGDEGFRGEIVIAFSPTRVDPVFTELLVETDEEERPQVSITLRGQGDDGERTVQRPRDIFRCRGADGELEQCNSIMVGDVGVGATGVREVVMVNPGCAVLTVTGVTYTVMSDVPEESFAVMAPEPPFTFSNHEEQSVEVNVSPVTEEAYVALLAVTWEDEQISASPVESDITIIAQGVDLELDLFPSRFTFGQAAVGQSQTETFRITNLGNRAGNVTAIELRDEDEVFHLTLPELPAVVMPPPGDVTFDVTYAPLEAGRDSNVVLVQTDAGTLEAVIMGGVLPQIMVVPGASIDFGEVETGETVTREVTVTNGGQADLEVFDIMLDVNPGSVFSLDGLPSFPVTLEPSDSGFTFDVTYTDNVSLADITGQLSIHSNDPAHEAMGYRISLNARGESVLAPDAKLVVSVEGVVDSSTPVFVTAGQTVEFDASESSTPDGGAMTFSWEFDRRPGSGTAELSSTSGPVVTLVPDFPGEWFIEVSVRDRFGQSSSRVAQLLVTD